MKVTLLIYFCCSLICCYGWRPYEIKLSNVTCFSIDENVLVNSTLNADGSLNVNMNLLRDFPELHFNSELYLDSGSGKYELEVLNKTLDVCRFLREPRYEPLIQLIYRMVLLYSNYPTKCPIPKNKYIIRQMRINTELLPPFFPEKKGHLRISFFDKLMKVIGGYSVFFEVAKKYKPK